MLFRLVTLQTLICSKAPADALIEPGEIDTDLLCGMIIDSTPIASAVLDMAPKF